MIRKDVARVCAAKKRKKHESLAPTCRLDHADELLPFLALRSRFPSRPCLSTLTRWATRGSGGVVLEAVKCGSRWYTTVAAVERFLARCNMTPEQRLDEAGC